MRAIVLTDVDSLTGGATLVKVVLETDPGVWWPKNLTVYHEGPLRLTKNEEIEVRYRDPGRPSEGYSIYG